MSCHIYNDALRLPARMLVQAGFFLVPRPRNDVTARRNDEATPFAWQAVPFPSNN